MYSSRRIAPLVLTAIVSILVIAILVAVGRALLNRTATTSTDEIEEVSHNLLSTESGHKVQMTVRGPIVAEENFRSYQITISPDSRRFVAYAGYLDSVLKDKSFENNTPAYEELIYALDRIKVMEGDEASGEANDVRGICSGGQLYEFAILDGDKTLKKLWTTSCKKSRGTLKASPKQAGDLILKQIPDGDKLVRQARVNTSQQPRL